MYHELCSTDTFENIRQKSFRIHDTHVFIIKSDHQFFAYLNQCPHQGIPLDWDNDQFLDIDEELIQCATHGALFDIPSGACLSGPCAGQSLRSLPLEVRENTLFIKLD